MFPGGSDSKKSACNVGDLGSIPELGRTPGEGNDNPLQSFCLENSMDRAAWQATSMGLQRVGHNWVTNIFTFRVSFVKSLPIKWPVKLCKLLSIALNCSVAAPESSQDEPENFLEFLKVTYTKRRPHQSVAPQPLPVLQKADIRPHFLIHLTNTHCVPAPSQVWVGCGGYTG